MSKHSDTRDLMLTVALLGGAALGLTGLYLWLVPGKKTAAQLKIGDRFTSPAVVALLNAEMRNLAPTLKLPTDLCLRVTKLATPENLGGHRPAVDPVRGTLVLAAALDDDRAGADNGKGTIPFFSNDVVGPCTQPASRDRTLPGPPAARPATPATPTIGPLPGVIGVVQPMPQTRMDLGSSFPMIQGRNYKIFENPIGSRPLPTLSASTYQGMRIDRVFLDPVSGVREVSVTFTSPSVHSAFAAPQASGVFVAVQDDVVLPAEA